MIHACNKYIVIKLEYEEEMRGIIVPDQAKQYSGEFYGEVVSVGDMVTRATKKMLKPGDRILYNRHEGWKIVDKHEKEYFAIRERWLVGKRIEKKESVC